MKKLLPVALTLFLMTGLVIASCTKKDTNPVGNYVCRCTIVTAGVTNTVNLPMNNIAKNTATTDCAAAQTTYNSGGSTATCSIN